MVQLVGILNITPDSFSDGGNYETAEKALAHARQLFSEGASIVDVGAESTRPNAVKLTPEEEWARLEQVLLVLMQEYPGKISLDTYHAETAERVLRFGDVIINDVTGMNNADMRAVVAKYSARVIISHLPGSDIQQAHAASEPVSNSKIVRSELLARAQQLIDAGLPEERIILDPGIGFGKTMELNKELLAFAEQLPDFPVMIGYSRKRFLGDNRMDIAPNLAAADVAVEHKAAYLRVHDVKAHAEHLRLL